MKEIYRKATVVTELNTRLGTVKYKEVLITDKENIHPGAFAELFSEAGDFVVQKGQKIFFFSGCTTPRFKVRQLCQKEDMAIVRTPEKASVAIVGDYTDSELAKPVNYFNGVFNKQDVINYILSTAKHSTSFLGFVDYLKKDDVAEEVLVDNYSIKQEFKTYGRGYSEDFWMTEKTNVEYFDMVMELGVPFVKQESLIKHLSQGTVMTQTMFEEMKNMFNSSDKNNHILAMEVMANCDYERSALFLLDLLSDKAFKINLYKEKNHVNFQSLCKFFNVDPGRMINHSEKMKILIERNLLNSSNKDEIIHREMQRLGIAPVDCDKEEDDDQNEEDAEITLFEHILKPSPALEEIIAKGDAYLKLKEEPSLEIIEEETFKTDIND